MNLQTFKSIYSDAFNWKVSYTSNDSHTSSTIGTLLSGVHYSQSDIALVDVDSKGNHIPLRDVISITKIPLSEYLLLQDKLIDSITPTPTPIPTSSTCIPKGAISSSSDVSSKVGDRDTSIQSLIAHSIETTTSGNYLVSGIRIAKTITARVNPLTCDTILHMNGRKEDDREQDFHASALITKTGYYIQVFSKDPMESKPIASGHYSHYNLLASVANCVNGIG